MVFVWRSTSDCADGEALVSCPNTLFQLTMSSARDQHATAYHHATLTSTP
jgi:hypothetical protein